MLRSLLMAKSVIKMIALDLDGTLLNSQKRISADDIATLVEAHERGIRIVPVTGRNYSFALPVAEMLPFDTPLVTTNGAIIRSRTGETYMRQLLPESNAREILAAVEEFHAYTVVVYDQQGPGHLRIQTGKDGDSAAETVSGGVADTLWLKKNEKMVQRFTSLTDAIDGDPLEILFTGPMKIIIALGERLRRVDNGLSIGEKVRLLRTEYPLRDFAILDAIHRDCSKGVALEEWSRRCGILPEEVMAIGDNYNDLEMLQFAGFPVVMGNADDELKQTGWPVTLDCDSSGVSHALRQYVL